MDTRPPVLVIAGPTAVGKTGLAIQIARKFNGEIISADSMQVYKHLSIGTAKPTRTELSGIPYHLIDHIEPNDQYNLGRFVQEAREVINDICDRGKIPIICGGTGLYIKGLLYGIFEGGEPDFTVRAELEQREKKEGLEALYKELLKIDPKASHVMSNDRQRILRYLEVFYSTNKPLSEYQLQKTSTRLLNSVIIRLFLDRGKLYDRINERVDKMLHAGLLSEVEQYLSSGYSIENPAINALGYSEIIAYLHNRISLEEALEKMKQKSRNYAKRQETWFRKQDFDLVINMDEFDFDEIAIRIQTKFAK